MVFGIFNLVILTTVDHEMATLAVNKLDRGALLVTERATAGW